MSTSDLAIDTTAAVAIMNRDAAIGQRLGTGISLYMPVTVLGELYYGAEKSARVAENIARVEYLLNSVTLLSATREPRASTVASINFSAPREGRSHGMTSGSRRQPCSITFRSSHAMPTSGTWAVSL